MMAKKAKRKSLWDSASPTKKRQWQSQDRAQAADTAKKNTKR
jgi:hypothetical protein